MGSYKHLLFISAIFCILAVYFVMTPNLIQAYSHGSSISDGNAGESGLSCSCHYLSDTEIDDADGTLTVTGFPTTPPTPNTSYPITVTFIHSTSEKTGFQAVVVKTADSTVAGTLTAGTGSIVSDGGYISHENDGTGNQTWEFTWTSPSSDVSNIKFYASAVAAKKTGEGQTNGSSDDDDVYTYASSEIISAFNFSSFVYDIINENDVKLKWRVVSEENNYGFEIERSIDGETFEKVDFVKGSGDKSTESIYRYVDNSGIAGDYYYRLRQVNFDGSFEYSPVIKINAGAPDEFGLFQNFPNPFNPSTEISYKLPNSAHVNLAVYNIQGVKIKTVVNENKPVGNYKIAWDGTNESGIPVSSGIYIYRIKAGKFSDSRKMIFIR